MWLESWRGLQTQISPDKGLVRRKSDETATNGALDVEDNQRQLSAGYRLAGWIQLGDQRQPKAAHHDGSRGAVCDE